MPVKLKCGTGSMTFLQSKSDRGKHLLATKLASAIPVLSKLCLSIFHDRHNCVRLSFTLSQVVPLLLGSLSAMPMREKPVFAKSVWRLNRCTSFHPSCAL
eukprot:gnl/MRDRNA2_/MRDRNA2_72467_c0_seq2.p1 gnl/MRDRNA2_/MRDRNA2_72467_c0~~gnl/MRDRNA2_/MRDRNA2_72467_c0_seq2.p1  ORF type:complete len:100 (+),score=10.41 gnl/MRDRNA2_/MRDRNA2_72467_c0_seq2:138-437(+)